MASSTQMSPYGPISEKMRVASLVELCDPNCGVQTGPFGSQLHKEDYVVDGTPIITVEHLGDNRILHENAPKVSDKDKIRLKKYTLKPGDVVFSRVGSVDRRALVRSTEDGWLFSGRCLRVRPNPAKADGEYLSYFFGLPAFQEHIRSIAVGATMPSLNTKLLSEVAVVIPQSVNEQSRIARILGTLDDKIELNRRMAATLEEMARAIFKSWFIDFDPVRAKAKGRPTNLPPEIDALFPNSFEDSELGPIPSGWRTGSIAELATVGGGSTPSTKNPEFWDGEFAWATPKDLSKLAHPVLLETERSITEAGLKSISSGLYPPGTVLMSSRAPIGYLAVSEIPVAVNQGFIALQPSVECGNLYLLRWLEFNMDAIHGRANGSTFMEISKSAFRSIETVLPSNDMVEAFSGLIDPLHRRLVQAVRESVSLATIRDLLLPKLISGAIVIRLNAFSAENA